MLGTDIDGPGPDDHDEAISKLSAVLGPDLEPWLAVDQLYTPDEVAIQMRVGVHVIRRLLRNGELQGVKIGGRWKVPPSAIEAYLKARLSG